MFNCKFCSVSYPVQRSVRYHEWFCQKNPSKKTKKNQYSNPYYVESEEVKKARSSRIAEQNTRPWSEERKARHKSSMQRAVIENPESYTSSNRGRVKQIIYNGEKLHGNWELIFAKWCDENSIVWEKCRTYFPYSWNGERKYFPDFYLPEKDVYIEVKGYETERDKCKWKHFPEDKTLVIIKKQEIKLIVEKSYIADW